MDPVVRTADFERIISLPTRQWDHASTEAAIDYWTKLYGRGAMRLFPNQARALSELATSPAKGIVAGLPVGEGKTLITMLAPLVLKAKRPVLVVPASLKGKTERDFEELRKHWHSHPGLELVTYSYLSSERNKDFFTTYRPDLLIADECHKWQYNPNKGQPSARTARVMRAFAADPEMRGVFLSGSITGGGSLWSIWLYVQWALKGAAPLPFDQAEADTWAQAIDAKLPPGVWRRPAGALLSLGGDGDDEVECARNGVHRRLASTPGIILVPPTKLDTKLTIKERPLQAPAEVEDAIQELKETWVTPNGEELENHLEVWRHGRELTCGFYQRWVPPAPEPWLNARRQYSRFIRDMLGQILYPADSHPLHLDTPYQVEKAFPTHQALVEWRRVQPTFEPNPQPFWLSDYMLEDAKRWLAESDEPGLVWVEHIEVGKRAAKLLGIPFYGAGVDAAEAVYGLRQSAVLSFAHAVGKNLQWCHRGLLLSNPPSDTFFEQWAGRKYRHGQTRDVELSLYLHTEPAKASFVEALEKTVAADALRGSRSRIMEAVWDIPSIDSREWRSERK